MLYVGCVVAHWSVTRNDRAVNRPALVGDSLLEVASLFRKKLAQVQSHTILKGHGVYLLVLRIQGLIIHARPTPIVFLDGAFLLLLHGCFEDLLALPLWTLSIYVQFRTAVLIKWLTRWKAFSIASTGISVP